LAGWHVKYLALGTQNGFGRNELEVSRKRNEKFTFCKGRSFAKYVLFIFVGSVFLAWRDIFFAALLVVVSFAFS